MLEVALDAGVASQAAVAAGNSGCDAATRDITVGRVLGYDEQPGRSRPVLPPGDVRTL